MLALLTESAFASWRGACGYFLMPLKVTQDRVSLVRENLMQKWAFFTAPARAKKFDIEAYQDAVRRFQRDPAAVPAQRSFEEDAAWAKASLWRLGIPTYDLARMYLKGDWANIKKLASTFSGDISQKGLNASELINAAKQLTSMQDQIVLKDWSALIGEKISESKWKKKVIQNYSKALIRRGLEGVLRDVGLYRDETRLQRARRRITSVIQSNEFQVIFNSILNTLFWKEGVISLPRLKFIKVKDKEIESILMKGVQMQDWREILKKQKVRAKAETINSVLATVVTVASFLIIAYLVYVDREEASKEELEADQERLRQLKQRSRMTPAQLAFEIWEQSEEERLGHPLDSTSQEYIQMREALFGESK